MSAIRRTAAHRASPLDLGEFLEEHGDLDFEEEVDYRSSDARPSSSGSGSGGATLECGVGMVSVNADRVAARQRKS